MLVRPIVLAVAVGMGMGVGAAGAQERTPGAAGGATAVSFGTGLSKGSSETGTAFGVAVDRLLVGRLRLEMAGAYLDRGTTAEAWTIHAGLLLDLAPATERAVPYLALGAGVYHATFQPLGLGREEDMPMSCSQRAGPASGTGLTTCPYGSMSEFYGRRLGPLSPPPGGFLGERAFTDPVVAVGGGVRWDVTRRLFMRPDARALLVMAEGDTQAVGLFTLSIGYRF